MYMYAYNALYIFICIPSLIHKCIEKHRIRLIYNNIALLNCDLKRMIKMPFSVVKVLNARED